MRGGYIHIYLAAMYSLKGQMREYAKILTEDGHEITSGWLREHTNSNVSSRFCREHALKDLRDIKAAEILVLFTPPPTIKTKHGGRHVEFGLAFAFGKKLIVCGPRENIFHYLPKVKQVDSFDELREALKSAI